MANSAAYYRGAMGILLVYDVTDEASFNNIRNWMRNIEQHASDTVNKVTTDSPAGQPTATHQQHFQNQSLLRTITEASANILPAGIAKSQCFRYGGYVLPLHGCTHT